MRVSRTTISVAPDAAERLAEHAVTVASYAVIWSLNGNGICAGELQISRRRLCLDGADRSGTGAALEIRADEILDVEVGRAPGKRIDGRPTIVVSRTRGDRVRIASATGVGLTGEIAEALGRLSSARNTA